MIKIVSSNIRFDNPADGDHNWKGRCDILTKVINDFSPSILGTQEGREPQLKDLQSRLKNLTLIDSHRDWINERMYPCLFIDESIFKVNSSGDIWLSNTPEIAGSKSFESAFPRLCTWVKVFHKRANKDIIVVDTHLDHLETKTRQKQIKVLINEIIKVNHENFPLILMGDFNEGPLESVSTLLESSILKCRDSWKQKGLAEEASHHSFTKTINNAKRIDWILTTESIEVSAIELYKESTNGIHPSDHFPVLATFEII